MIDLTFCNVEKEANCKIVSVEDNKTCADVAYDMIEDLDGGEYLNFSLSRVKTQC